MKHVAIAEYHEVAGRRGAQRAGEPVVERGAQVDSAIRCRLNGGICPARMIFLRDRDNDGRERWGCARSRKRRADCEQQRGYQPHDSGILPFGWGSSNPLAELNIYLTRSKFTPSIYRLSPRPGR